ncbi:MAG: hypothetical protein ACT4QA_05550 [Panacagrimonas sp.]
MGNLTLAIDDESLKRARIRALEMGTSVNQLVRDYIEGLGAPATAPDYEAVRRFDELLELCRKGGFGNGGKPYNWTREEINDRDLQRREEAAFHAQNPRAGS